MHHFHSTDLLTRAHLEISSLVSHYCVSWWSDRLLQDDFFVTLGTCFAKGWVVSSRVGVSAIFAVFLSFKDFYVDRQGEHGFCYR